VTLEITEVERDFLAELLEVAHREKLRELHHTVTHDYRRFVRGQVEMLESLRERLGLPAAVKK
jgi:hypothetical protein